MSTSPAPFSCSYSRDLPDLLELLDCSLVLSTYQAGKVILLSPNGENLVQLTRNFRAPMGMAVDEHAPPEAARMAVATKDDVVVLRNAPALAPAYPRKPGTYDGFFVPRTAYFTGPLDIHDMAFSGDRLWAVNTRFSCLCHLDDRASFHPVWKPPFVSALAPEDRCHLNGLAMENGRPRYVTALGATDTPRGWSEGRTTGGILMDLKTNDVLASGLGMPHSPRLYDGRLFVLASATGALLEVDRDRGDVTEIRRVPGFARGLARRGDYLFVGHSRLRQRHVFGDLPVARSDVRAGVTVIHLPTGAVAGGLHYHLSCEEIYDVHVLPGMRRPNILGVEDELYRQAIVTPETAYWTVPDEKEKGQAAGQPETADQTTS